MELPRSFRKPTTVEPRRQSELEWIAQIGEYLDQGALGQAHDLIPDAIAQFPTSQPLHVLGARVLVRADALEDARQLLEQIVPDPIHAEKQLHKLWVGVVKLAKEARGKASAEADDIETLSHLVRDLESARSAVGDSYDEEALGMLAKVHKALWVRTGSADDLDVAFGLYRRAFLKFGGIWSGINAATLALLLGEEETARALATQVLERCQSQRKEDPYWIHATRGEA